MHPIRQHLTYANVISTLALFLVLAGGTTLAATGGNFILGQPNTAGQQTSLTAQPSFAGKALQLTNTNTGAGATALGLNVASGHPPFMVNSSTRVANLTATTANPIAFAHVSAAGAISRSKGMANATVTNPQQGFYCLRGLSFAFRGAQVTTDFDDATGQIAPQFGSTVPSTCSPQANAYVATVGSDDLGHNAGFFIVFYN
jgi:hypothetical protein